MTYDELKTKLKFALDSRNHRLSDAQLEEVLIESGIGVAVIAADMNSVIKEAQDGAGEAKETGTGDTKRKAYGPRKKGLFKRGSKV